MVHNPIYNFCISVYCHFVPFRTLSWSVIQQAIEQAHCTVFSTWMCVSFKARRSSCGSLPTVGKKAARRMDRLIDTAVLILSDQVELLGTYSCTCCPFWPLRPTFLAKQSATTELRSTVTDPVPHLKQDVTTTTSRTVALALAH